MGLARGVYVYRPKVIVDGSDDFVLILMANLPSDLVSMCLERMASDCSWEEKA